MRLKATVAAVAAVLAASTVLLVPPAQPAAGDSLPLIGGIWGDATADVLSVDSLGRYQPSLDSGSLYTITTAIGARALWASLDAGKRPITGRGVGVALLDSGLDRVPGLDGVGKVNYGPDLSIEGNGVLTDRDTFGHGTFMAGIVAGRGTTSTSASLANAAPSTQLGIAPDAELLGIKLATTDGSVDVSQVIAALDWVTQHPVLPDGTRIRVINLSYGTDSAQPYQLDPLAAAAENAWRHGIVVVTSAGNSGTGTGRLTDPAIDPYVLAVGAANSNHDLLGWTPPLVTKASYSNVAPTGRHPDLIAPGTSVVSFRDPGSFIDANNPQGRVAGDTSGTLFRGSGTSQAAAVVSGAVALLLQAYPSLTPDQVKAALVSSASPMLLASPSGVGAGEINLTGALAAAKRIATGLTKVPAQTFPTATGGGSIDAARGGSVVVDADGNDLSGEIDVQGNPWAPAAWYRATSTLTAWSGGQWLGHTYTGDGWNQTASPCPQWTSARWSSARWSDANWSSSSWTSARWSSARWSSARWSSARWSSNDW
jgi:serine protease AprX